MSSKHTLASINAYTTTSLTTLYIWPCYKDNAIFLSSRYLVLIIDCYYISPNSYILNINTSTNITVYLCVH